MRDAGCYEVLYGLESISPRMQRRMCKYPQPLPPEEIRQVFNAMRDVGLGTHVNLLVNFPGDTPQEMWDSVEFTVETLKDMARATFTLNRFVLFPGTTVAKQPSDFSATVEPLEGDIPGPMDYRLTLEATADEEKIDRALPAAKQRLD